MNYDIHYYLTQFIHEPSDLSNFCFINRDFYYMCQYNKNLIAKHFLKLYKVNYQNKNDFIYYGYGVNQKNYIDSDGKWKYPSIFKLYMKHFYKKEIKINEYDITSIPFYPKLEVLYCMNTQLTSLPEYPNLIKLECNYNQLTSLPEYPNLKELDCRNNQLTSLPKYPKLYMCKADNRLCYN